MTRLPASVVTLPGARSRASWFSSLMAPAACFARDEGGSATIEFTLFVPTFLFLFMSSFESGMLLVRQVMLDRAVDLTVRDVRLGNFDTVDPEDMFEALKAAMCDTATQMNDCERELKLEMQPVDPRAWSMIDAEADCVDREDDDSIPFSNFVPGVQNQLMIIRACALFDPFFPTLGLGAMLAEPAGYYALVSSSAYVIEPS